MKWSDVQSLGFRIRNKDCQPFSYYVNSIKQVGTFSSRVTNQDEL